MSQATDTTLEAIQLLTALAGMALNTMATIQTVSNAVAAAQAQGRPLSPSEWQSILDLDDVARARVEAALAKEGAPS